MAYPTFQRTMRCPQCDNTLTVSLQPVVDVGEDPKQRQRFLKGELNVVRCPRCGFAGSPATPMVYHDPARQLMLAYVPHELGLTLPQEEQEIGRLTNLVLENTPTAQRKAYLLNPTRVMTMDGLYEKVLEAEGVSAEEIRKQTAKIQLVTQMAKAVGDDAALTALIEAHREEIDYNFLVLVTMTIQQAAEVHDEATVERYGSLREKIITQLGLTADEVPSLGVEQNIDELIDMLLATPAMQLQSAVAANRPLLDYNFFMHLTQRAEQAIGEEQERLFALRKQVVEMTDEMDQMAREAMERAAGHLNALLQAEDIEAKLQELYYELDEAFLVVLSANVEQARAQGRDDIVEVLMRIYSHVVNAMEARLRPELRAVNQLLRMESSDERKARLREELRTYNPAGFIEMVEAIAGDLEESGRGQPQMLERLYTILDEAREIVANEMDELMPPPQEPLFREEKARSSGEIWTPGDERRGQPEGEPKIILP